MAAKKIYELNTFFANYPDGHCKLSFSYKQL